MEPTINTLDVNSFLTPNQEKMDITENGVYLGMKPDDFSRNIDLAERNAEKNQPPKLKDRQTLNLKYWLGQQVDRTQLRDDLEHGVENIIFRNLDTFIPTATSQTPEHTVGSAYKNEAINQFCEQIRSIGQTEWEDYQVMQPLLSRGVLNHQINFLGVFMLGYDADLDEFYTEELLATDFVISKDGKMIIRYVKDRPLEELLAKFPDKEADIQKELKMGISGTIDKSLYSTLVTWKEAWTDEWVGWKINDLFLGLEKNPHYDYTGSEVQATIANTGQQVKTTVKYNHFKKPRHPFLFLKRYNRGQFVHDDTSLIEQAIGIQDWVNKRKRQIGANADSTNGHWISSGDFISREEFDKIQGGIDEKIWLESGQPADGIRKEMGQPLPDIVLLDLQDSRSAMDSLMGTHDTTRGEKSSNNTLGQDILQKNGDYGRVDGYVRDCIEPFAREWFAYMYHMYLVYRQTPKAIAVPNDGDLESESVVFDRNTVPLVQDNDGTVIPIPLIFRVKNGSTLPRDEVAEWQKAQNMKDVLCPIDFFRMAGEPNPKQLAKNFLIWSKNPYMLFPNDQDMQQLQQWEQQQQQMLAQQQAAAQGGQPAAAAGQPTGQQQSDSGQPPVAQAEGANGQPSSRGVANAMMSMIHSGQVPKSLADRIMNTTQQSQQQPSLAN